MAQKFDSSPLFLFDAKWIHYGFRIVLLPQVSFAVRDSRFLPFPFCVHASLAESRIANPSHSGLLRFPVADLSPEPESREWSRIVAFTRTTVAMWFPLRGTRFRIPNRANRRSALPSPCSLAPSLWLQLPNPERDWRLTRNRRRSHLRMPNNRGSFPKTITVASALMRI